MNPPEQAARLLKRSSFRMAQFEKDLLQRVIDGADLSQPELGQRENADLDMFKRLLNEFASDLA